MVNIAKQVCRRFRNRYLCAFLPHNGIFNNIFLLLSLDFLW
jgi:hypothetical protein